MNASALWQAYPKGSEERRLVEDAFALAQSAHKQQERTGGDPYIVHPLAVATLVQEFGLDAPSVAAALLHDTVEDTETTLEEVKTRFGEEVAQIVDALTKVEGIQYQADDLHKAETYRKIILATAHDIRVVVIKLLDRLHNIETADVFSPERRERYARETLDVYAPIAHRLGFAKLKDELENNSFALLEPEEYVETVNIIKKRVEESRIPLQALAAHLQTELEESGIKGFEITFREKSPYSLHLKLARGRSLQDAYDIFGLRVITESLEDCYLALGKIHALWHPVPGRFTDYIANPKRNMYQSLHTTVSSDEEKIVFEVQIRTQEMHAIAQYGIAAHWHYKEARRDKLAVIDTWLEDLAAQQRFIQDPAEILDTLIAETFKEEIYTLTPQGNVRVLPIGATPVDFAYAVHSDVGDHCVGAKVNGRISPLSRTLATGDIVEVMTTRSESARPSVDWLRFVVTHKAKTHIRKFVQQETRAEDERQGLKTLQDEFRKRHLPFAISAEMLVLLHCASAEELYIKVGSGKLSPKQVTKTAPKEEDPASPWSLPALRARRQTSGAVTVGGSATGIAQEIARCCNPLPGDEIRAYVSTGRGMIIHRADCVNLATQDPARVIVATWPKRIQGTFLSRIKISAWDRPRLLEDITHLLGERGANLTTVSTTVDKEIVRGEMEMQLGSAQSLDGILTGLRAIDGVLMVERI